MSYNIVNPKIMSPQGEVRFNGIRYEFVKLDSSIDSDRELMDEGYTHFFCKDFDNMYKKTEHGVQFNPLVPVFAVKMLKTIIRFNDGQVQKGFKRNDYI